MSDGLLVIFFPLKIMRQRQLLRQVYQFMLGKVKQKRSIGGVLNKQLKVRKIGNLI
jgi:hypothetical protein